MYRVLGSDQQVYGPVTAVQLRQWMAEGRVNLSTLIQLEGATDWKPLSAFPDFAVPPLVSLPRPQARRGGSDTALWSLVCGILCNICCCCSTLFAVLGLILSIIVLNSREDYPNENQRLLAMIGLVLSIIGLLWHWLLPLFVFIPGAWGYRQRWWHF
jgi:hypothetical protein